MSQPWPMAHGWSFNSPPSHKSVGPTNSNPRNPSWSWTAFSQWESTWEVPGGQGELGMAMTWILIIDTTKTYSWTARPVGFPRVFPSRRKVPAGAEPWTQTGTRFSLLFQRKQGSAGILKPAESTPGDLSILRCRVRAPGDPPAQNRSSSSARRLFRPGCPKVVQPGFESELQLLIEDEPADGPTGRRRFDSRRGHDGRSDGSRRPVPWRTPPTGGKRGHAEHHEQQWDHQAPHEVRQREPIRLCPRSRGPDWRR